MYPLWMNRRINPYRSLFGHEENLLDRFDGVFLAGNFFTVISGIGKW